MMLSGNLFKLKYNQFLLGNKVVTCKEKASTPFHHMLVFLRHSENEIIVTHTHDIKLAFMLPFLWASRLKNYFFLLLLPTPTRCITLTATVSHFVNLIISVTIKGSC